MIDSAYLGQPVDGIDESRFSYGFDDPSLLDQRYPSLVLASLERVPRNAESWFLASQDCGGFACDQEFGAILPMSIRPEMLDQLSAIANEDFAGDGGLDYYGVSSKATQKAIQAGYIESVTRIGLTCPTGLAVEHLTQALYPIEVTEQNIQALTTDQVRLDRYADVDLMIFIVGENCD